MNQRHNDISEEEVVLMAEHDKLTVIIDKDAKIALKHAAVDRGTTASAIVNELVKREFGIKRQ